MKARNCKSLPRIVAVFVFVLALSSGVRAAEPASWTGTYFDKNRLSGKAYFQLALRESGNAIDVVFNAAYHDGQGVAPEAQASANRVNKDTLEFRFKDSLKNSGSGTIRRSGSDIVVDFIFANAVDKRALVFYERNMRLRRAGK